MEDQSTDEKQYFINLLKMINQSSSRTIEILRTNPVSNIKLINRSGKSLKDSNPLSKHNSSFNTKIPNINFKRKRRQAKDDKRFFNENENMIRNVHNTERILCRKEAVD